MNRITKIVHPEIEFEKWIRKETNLWIYKQLRIDRKFTKRCYKNSDRKNAGKKKKWWRHIGAHARARESERIFLNTDVEQMPCVAVREERTVGKPGETKRVRIRFEFPKKETDDERRREELSGFGERNFEISRNAKVAGTRNNRTPGSALLFACQMCKQKQQQTRVDCNLRSNCWTITRVKNKYQLYIRQWYHKISLKYFNFYFVYTHSY